MDIYVLQSRWKIENNRLKYYGLRNKENMFKNEKHINKKHPQINVSVRNFKLSAEELKKKLKVKDGGNKYLFGTTDNLNNAILIICNKIT